MSAAKKTYFEMAREAIVALKERSGSSSQAIKKHMCASNKSLNFAQHLLRDALKKGVDSGKLTRVKASFKINKDAVVKKPAAKKAAPKKADAPAAKKGK
jgi:histone H1/5